MWQFDENDVCTTFRLPHIIFGAITIFVSLASKCDQEKEGKHWESFPPGELHASAQENAEYNEFPHRLNKPGNDDEKLEFEYMPSISLAEVDVPQRKNESWMVTQEHRFTNSKPFTAYNVTVYVRPMGN